jgi:hypothetical protein
MDLFDDATIDPYQRLAAAVIQQAIEDAIASNSALQWLASPAALGWLALIAPPDRTPQDLQQAALRVARQRRAAAHRRYAYAR